MTDNNHAATLKIRGGVEIDSYGKKAGKGPLVQWELSGTLGASQDQTLFVWRDATTPVETGGGADSSHHLRRPSKPGDGLHGDSAGTT